MLNRYDVGLVLGALADPTRRAIIERLGAGPSSMSELADPLPISLPAVLQQVRILERSGLVSTTKTGRVRTCRLEVGPLDMVQDWIAARRRTWERRLDRLGSTLADPDASSSNSLETKEGI